MTDENERPTLRALTLKEEHFCQALLEHGEKTTAYSIAYDASGMAPPTIKNEACKLSKLPHVAVRIAELEAEAAYVAGLCKTFILRGLMRESMPHDDGGAKEGAARVRALEILGKHLGVIGKDDTDTGPVAGLDELQRNIEEIDKQIAAEGPDTPAANVVKLKK